MITRPTRAARTTQNKISPITCYVICEGFKDESKYFAAIENKIKNRYQGNLIFVPINRSSTASAPKKVLEELKGFLKTNKIKISQAQNNYVFMIIDKDHHFSANHRKGTLEALRECEQMSVEVIVNVPSFEIWELCHFKDLTNEPEKYLKSLLENKKVSNKNTFSKKEVGILMNGKTHEHLVPKLTEAIQNENSLRNKFPCDQVPPSQLQSNVGTLFKLFEQKGYSLNDMFIE